MDNGIPHQNYNDLTDWKNKFWSVSWKIWLTIGVVFSYGHPAAIREKTRQHYPGKYWAYKLRQGTTFRIEFHCYDSDSGKLANPPYTNTMSSIFPRILSRERTHKRENKAFRQSKQPLYCVRARASKTPRQQEGYGWMRRRCLLARILRRRRRTALCTKNNLHGFLAGPITRSSAHRRPFVLLHETAVAQRAVKEIVTRCTSLFAKLFIY